LINTVSFVDQIYTNEVWAGQLTLLPFCEDLATSFQFTLLNSFQMSSSILFRSIIGLQQSVDFLKIFFNVAI